MNRHERRKASKVKQTVLVTFSREIFTTPNLRSEEVHLDVGSMRTWAEKNVVPQKIEITPEHVQRLVAGGTVTKDKVMGYTMNQTPKPILVCENAEGLGDEIVDGNHTYVATALSWAAGVEQGLFPATMRPFVIGYGLTPQHWRPFVVPASHLRK